MGRSDPRQVAHQGLVNWAFGCEIGRETGGDLVGVTRRLGVATRGGPCGEIQELAWFQQLKKIHQVVELADTPAVRGMINRVSYLVRLES